MSIAQLLTQQLSGPALQQIAGSIGADTGSTGKAVGTAVPLLLGAMANNAQEPQGAEALAGALEKDHDGSILDSLGGAGGLASMAGGLLGGGGGGNPMAALLGGGAGDGILKHLLGGQRSQVETQVAQASGLNQQSVSQLLTVIAPLVMGAVGKQKKQQGLDVAGLVGMLSGERQAAQGAGGGMLGALLDKDGDGDVTDDIGGMIGGLFGKK